MLRCEADPAAASEPLRLARGQTHAGLQGTGPWEDLGMELLYDVAPMVREHFGAQ